MRRKPTRTTTATKAPSFLPSNFNFFSIALLAGVLILGIGIGIAFSSTATLSPSNVASRDFIDRSAPNPELCVQYGASAMVMDTRLFVSLNPFNVYVAQPSLKPGCVLRTSNWDILKQYKLLPNDKERDCKQRMNTFAYTGELGSSPQVDCVYQNDSAKNFYLNQPGSVAPQESERF
jgi:hypothetical protein